MALTRSGGLALIGQDVESVAPYNAVIVGSAVHLDRWMGPARDLVNRSADALNTRPVWLFSSGPLGRDIVDPADAAEGMKLLELVGARDHRVFAGKADKQELGFVERRILSMVKNPYGDHRDWSAIDDWAVSIARERSRRSRPAPDLMEIETHRLIVRPFRPDDWQGLFAYLSLPETYVFEPGEPIDAEQARALAEDRPRGSGFWAVELRAEQRMVGHLSFQQIEPADLRTYELGYIFNPRAQRHGYATEAARGLIGHASAAMDAHRVIANCNPANVASCRVLEKIGFEREGRLRRNIFFRRDSEGSPLWQNTFEYGLLNNPGGGAGRLRQGDEATGHVEPERT
jgi:ribosomal-protein-alanine N-acetyltransferase